MRRTGSTSALLALPLLGLLFSCQVMETPSGWVSVDPDSWSSQVFQAVAPSGNTLTIEEYDNPREGTLDFWAAAIRNELVEARGYELLSTTRVVTEDGRPGTELLFDAQRDYGSYRYLVTIFIVESSFLFLFDDSNVYVIEAGGESESLEADLEAIRAAIKTFD